MSRQAATHPDQADSWRGHLPLRPVVFTVLMSLAEENLHGYAILAQVNERLQRRALLGAGTLYRTLKELREAGLIEWIAAPTEETVDERRQYYRLTEPGRSLASAEARRLADLVAQARKSRLLRST